MEHIDPGALDRPPAPAKELSPEQPSGVISPISPDETPNQRPVRPWEASETRTPSPPKDQWAEAGDIINPLMSPALSSGFIGRIGDFDVSYVIGVGGEGVVVKAHDRTLKREVAIKVLAPKLAVSPIARQRFLREARIAAGIRHDNVVIVHAVGESHGLPYIVMEHVDGPSLQQLIEADGALPVTEVARLAREIASGLAAAHSLGVIHRDLKPANVLLASPTLRAKIVDFGLARAIDDVSLSQQGVIAGTPHFMSPEQARGEPLDHRSDLFSLGSLIYAMATGVYPFPGENSLAIFHAIWEREPIAMSMINPNIPPWIESLVRRLLRKSPAERFASAHEALLAMEVPIAVPIHEHAAQSAPKPDEIAVPVSLWKIVDWYVVFTLFLAIMGILALLFHKH